MQHDDTSASALMGDGTEPVPLLDAATVKRLARDIIQVVTRDGLARLEALIVRTYESPKNATALLQVRERIKAQRAIIARNDPR